MVVLSVAMAGGESSKLREKVKVLKSLKMFGDVSTVGEILHRPSGHTHTQMGRNYKEIGFKLVQGSRNTY